MANDILQLCFWDGSRERLPCQPRLGLLLVRKGEADQLKLAERGP